MTLFTAFTVGILSIAGIFLIAYGTWLDTSNTVMKVVTVEEKKRDEARR